MRDAILMLVYAAAFAVLVFSVCLFLLGMGVLIVGFVQAWPMLPSYNIADVLAVVAMAFIGGVASAYVMVKSM